MNRKLIKNLEFNENEFNANRVILLNSNFKFKNNKILIKDYSNHLIYKTKIYYLNACKKILMLQTVFEHDCDLKFHSIENYIDLKHRIYTNDNEYYYNGTEWVVNNTLWNTEKEICENIDKFVLPSDKGIGFIVKIQKGVNYDSQVNIVLEKIKILVQCNLNHAEDIIYKTFCDKVEAECFGQSRFQIDNFSGSKLNFLTILNDQHRCYKNPNPIEIYNLTDDPNQLNNLIASYDSNLGVVQLNASMNISSKLMVLFEYNPSVSVSRSVDYVELSSVPSLTVFNFQEIITYYGVGGMGDYIFNNDTGEGYSIEDPQICDYEFQVFVDAKSQYDYLNLKEQFQKWIRQNILLRSWGLDEEYDMLQLTGFNDSTNPNLNDVRRGIIRIIIKNVLLYKLDAYQDLAIKETIYTLE